MDIRQSTSQAALLDVFRSCRRRAGDSIADLELVSAWARTGLRWCDLEAALDALTRRGLLAMRVNGRSQRVVLTRAGCRAIEARHGEWLLRLTDWCRRQWVRLDELTPTEPAPRRGSWLMGVVVVVATVLIVTSPAAQPQVLTSHTLCAVLPSGACAGAPVRGAPCPVSARDGSVEPFPQWAAAMHRAAVGDAAVRALAPWGTDRRGQCRTDLEARPATPALVP